MSGRMPRGGWGGWRQAPKTPARREPRITRAERLLMGLLSDERANLPQEGAALVAGNRSGRLVMELLRRTKLLVTAHAFDVHHAKAIAKRLTEEGERRGKVESVVRCEPYVGGPYEAAFFMTTPRSMPAELVLDQLQDVHNSLADGGSLYAAFEGDPDDALKTMKLVWKSVHVLERDRRSILMRAVKYCEPVKVRDFSATWTAGLPGGAEVEFTSLPGCFCHRRADLGGLSLAEVAAEEIAAKAPKDGIRILDMGCGCGFVGLLVADAARRAGVGNISLTLIDSHSRAIEAARINARRMGIESEFILADDGLPRGRVGEFDLFVGNPPYYSEYRIAEVFLETAYRALRPGGVCLSVVKTASGLKPVQAKYFPDVRTINRRGYCVLRSIRL